MKALVLFEPVHIVTKLDQEVLCPRRFLILFQKVLTVTSLVVLN